MVERITREKFNIYMFTNMSRGILERCLDLSFNLKGTSIYYAFWFSRSKDVIEPLEMEQWFVNMEEMSQMGINVSVSRNTFDLIFICLL